MWWTLLFSHKDFYCLCFQRYSQVSPLRARFPWRCKWSHSVQWLEACPAVISLGQQEKTVHLPFTIAFPSVQRVGRYFPIKLQDKSLLCWCTIPNLWLEQCFQVETLFLCVDLSWFTKKTKTKPCVCCRVRKRCQTSLLYPVWECLPSGPSLTGRSALLYRCLITHAHFLMGSEIRQKTVTVWSGTEKQRSS